MNAAELAHLVETWTDALTVAEVVESPFLRLTDQWDLSDWQTVDLPDGLEFQRFGGGAVTETVKVVNTGEQRLDRFPVDAAVPTWVVRVREDGKGPLFARSVR